MNVRSRIVLACCFDKSVDKFVILFATHPRLSETEIELVFEESLVLHFDQRRWICFLPSDRRTSVPQSSTTGSVLDGWMPAQRVVMTSLAIEIRIPPTPMP